MDEWARSVFLNITFNVAILFLRNMNTSQKTRKHQKHTHIRTCTFTTRVQTHLLNLESLSIHTCQWSTQPSATQSSALHSVPSSSSSSVLIGNLPSQQQNAQWNSAPVYVCLPCTCRNHSESLPQDGVIVLTSIGRKRLQALATLPPPSTNLVEAS